MLNYLDSLHPMLRKGKRELCEVEPLARTREKSFEKSEIS